MLTNQINNALTTKVIINTFKYILVLVFLDGKHLCITKKNVIPEIKIQRKPSEPNVVADNIRPLITKNAEANTISATISSQVREDFCFSFINYTFCFGLD